MASEAPIPAIQDPPEHVQGDGPGDTEMYAKMQEVFGDRLNGVDDDILPRFVRGYATEEKREEVTTEKLQGFLDKSDECSFPTMLDEPWEPFDECARTWEVFLYGQDQFGHPVVYDKVGCSNVTAMRQTFLSDGEGNYEKLEGYRFRVQAEINKFKKGQRLKYGKMIYKHVLVFDLSGFSSSHFTGSDIRNAVKHVIGAEQNIFPETLHKLFIINSPWVFRAAWSVISYFVDPLTYKKISLVGSGFISDLRKEIADDQIPREYGGSGQWDIRLGRAATDELNDLLAAQQS